MLELDKSQKNLAIPSVENWRLEIASPGFLDTLMFREAKRLPPAPGEVEIEVCFTGINFKEVLIALGMFPVNFDSNIQFGFECSGKIAAIGEGVQGFEIGDEVIAFAASCFSAFTTTSAFFVAPKPANLTLEEAATIPVAFITAYYSLKILGRLLPGEKVLIHAAAGGVGLAAVQIAQMIGAEIFATAGSPEKRAFLHSLGIECVMDSRSFAFADEVMKRTNGRGVDVVLNSLGGEFIPKTLSVLAPYGRFLEISKRDIYNNSQLGMRAFEKSLSFIAITVDPSQIPNFNLLWSEFLQNFTEGTLKPLPYRVFPSSDVKGAFEYMAQAKHIGKILVSLQDKEALRALAFSQSQSATRQEPVRRPVVVSSPLAKPADTRAIQGHLKDGLLSSEGVDVFRRILCGTLPQVIVSTRDLPSLLEQTNAAEGLVSQIEPAAEVLPKPAAHPRPKLSNAYCPPRNALERTMTEVWQNFFGFEQVGVYDDFFELGGDSLMAVQLIAKLREMLQTELSPHSLLDSPYIAGLAESIARTTFPSMVPLELTARSLPPSLVEIKSGNFKEALFLIHPIGGHVYFYRDLAYSLGSDWGVYGLQAKGLDGKEEPLTTVEDMATHYIEAIRVVQSEGPYFLGGASFGGMVAFEMAQKLLALGEKVALLTLIDTPGREQISPEILEDDEAKILAYSLGVGDKFEALSDRGSDLTFDEQILYLLDRVGMANKVLPDLALPEVRNFIRLFKVNARAMLNYVPRSYPGRVIFFRASDRDAINLPNPERGWMNLVDGGLELHEISGSHITMNFPPHVQVMAERLKMYLDEAWQKLEK